MNLDNFTESFLAPFKRKNYILPFALLAGFQLATFVLMIFLTFFALPFAWTIIPAVEEYPSLISIFAAGLGIMNIPILFTYGVVYRGLWYMVIKNTKVIDDDVNTFQLTMDSFQQIITHGIKIVIMFLSPTGFSGGLIYVSIIFITITLYGAIETDTLLFIIVSILGLFALGLYLISYYIIFPLQMYEYFKTESLRKSISLISVFKNLRKHGVSLTLVTVLSSFSSYLFQLVVGFIPFVSFLLIPMVIAHKLFYSGSLMGHEFYEMSEKEERNITAD